MNSLPLYPVGGMLLTHAVNYLFCFVLEYVYSNKKIEPYSCLSVVTNHIVHIYIMNKQTNKQII